MWRRERRKKKCIKKAETIVDDLVDKITRDFFRVGSTAIITWPACSIKRRILDASSYCHIVDTGHGKCIDDDYWSGQTVTRHLTLGKSAEKLFKGIHQHQHHPYGRIIITWAQAHQTASTTLLLFLLLLSLNNAKKRRKKNLVTFNGSGSLFDLGANRGEKKTQATSRGRPSKTQGPLYSLDSFTLLNEMASKGKKKKKKKPLCVVPPLIYEHFGEALKPKSL